MNFLDKAISVVSPSLALKRERSRFVQKQIADHVRKYEGAASGRRTDNWRAVGTSANAEIEVALNKLRDRSRDLVRNNSYAKRAVRAITTNTIGRGIQPAPYVGDDKTSEKRIKDLWWRWAEDRISCDYLGKKTFY